MSMSVWRIARRPAAVADTPVPTRRSRGLQSSFRRLGSTAAIVGLLCGIGVYAAADAGAVTCSGDYCSGQDPQAAGCAADAYTVVSARIPGTYSYIELRWSPTCKSNWARVPSSWGTAYPGNLSAVQRSTGYRQVGVVSSNNDYSWTRMIYSPTLCVYAAWTGSPGSVGTSCA